MRIYCVYAETHTDKHIITFCLLLFEWNTKYLKATQRHISADFSKNLRDEQFEELLC